MNVRRICAGIFLSVVLAASMGAKGSCGGSSGPSGGKSSNRPSSSKRCSVIFSITGSPKIKAHVNWLISDNGTGTHRLNNVSIPFHTQSMRCTGKSVLSTDALVTTSGGSDSEIRCRILVNGHEEADERSQGKFPGVSCHADFMHGISG